MQDVAEFDPVRFQTALTTRAIGRFLSYRTVTETTMVIARREADEGAPHGTLILAEEQTSGRGRRGRSFYSPAGQNLYFTLVLRPGMDTLKTLPVRLPVALARALSAEGVMALVKWPNDIWVGGLKVSGMLIDSELISEREAIALPGVGINVNGDPAENPELAGIATSLRNELKRDVVREVLLARICTEIEQTMAQPFDQVLEEYRTRSAVIGREVTVQSGAESFEAQATGILDDGSLLIRRADGTAESVTAADVSVRPADSPHRP